MSPLLHDIVLIGGLLALIALAFFAVRYSERHVKTLAQDAEHDIEARARERGRRL